LSRKEEINAEAQRRRGGAYRGTAPGVPGRGRDTLGTAGETPALHRCHGRGCPRDCRRDASVTQMSWARTPSGLPAGRQRYTDVMGEDTLGTAGGTPALHRCHGRDTLGTAGETPALHRCHGRGCPRDCRRDASVTQMSWARHPRDCRRDASVT